MKDIELLNDTFSSNQGSQRPFLYIIDDEDLLRISLKRFIQSVFRDLEVVVFRNPTEFLSHLKCVYQKEDFILITDMSFGGFELDGISLIDQLKKMDVAGFETIMMTGFGSIETAINATKRGVFKYLTKPFAMEDIREVVSLALESLFSSKKMGTHSIPSTPGVDQKSIYNDRLSSSLVTIDGLPSLSESDRFGRIIGQSNPMQELFSRLDKVAASNSTVLILGESGTGKELVAREIHLRSNRANGALVDINCGAIPADILESELFGHTKGAFTGAVSNRMGKFEAGDHGSIFLDEIGDMPLLLQVKILRVLQTKVIEPVGSNQQKLIDTRVIAATHKNLSTLVQEGKFREDLYYRLNVIPLRIPALRERRGDIPYLLRFFIEKYMSGNKANTISFSKAAYDCLMSYEWPGNVRELENLVERLIILKGGSIIEPIDLPGQMIRFQRSSDKADHILPDEGLNLKEHLLKIEQSLIQQALSKTSGNKNKASKLLRINRTTLIEKLKRIDVPGFNSEKNTH